jgi:hypothetical protein
MPPALEWWDENYALVRDLAVRGYACHVQAYDAVLADPARVVPRIVECGRRGGPGPRPSSAGLKMLARLWWLACM